MVIDLQLGKLRLTIAPCGFNRKGGPIGNCGSGDDTGDGCLHALTRGSVGNVARVSFVGEPMRELLTV